MRRGLLIMAMLFACVMCFAETYSLTLRLYSHVPPRAEVVLNGETPVIVSNFSESATAAIEEREGYQVVTFTAA